MNNLLFVVFFWAALSNRNDANVVKSVAVYSGPNQLIAVQFENATCRGSLWNGSQDMFSPSTSVPVPMGSMVAGAALLEGSPPEGLVVVYATAPSKDYRDQVMTHWVALRLKPSIEGILSLENARPLHESAFPFCGGGSVDRENLGRVLENMDGTIRRDSVIFFLEWIAWLAPPIIVIDGPSFFASTLDAATTCAATGSGCDEFAERFEQAMSLVGR